MAKKSLIIIGSGLSGLSAGTFAQRAGYNATIFEQHHHSGGLAAFWKRGGFNIDGGICFLMGCKPGLKSFELFKELDVGDPQLYIPMKEYTNFIDEKSGARIKVGQDLDKLQSDLMQMAPKDSAIIEEVMKIIKGLKGKDTAYMGMLKPPELENTLSNLKLMWEMKPLMKYMTKRYTQSMASFTEEVKTESLKRFLNNIFTPNAPVSFALSLIASMAGGQMSFIKGGCRTFVTKMERHYRSLGGQLRCRAKVTKILTENNRACGIELANGEQIRGNYIVSASDTENTIYNLLEGKYTNQEIEHIHKTWEPAGSYMLITYGIDQDLNNEPTITHINLKQPISYGDKELATISLRIMNYGDFAPKGKSVMQALLTPSFDYWARIGKDKEQYEEERRRFSDEVLDRISIHYPSIKEKVEMINVATPWTMHKITSSKAGSAQGWELTRESFTKKRYRTLPGLKNFYMAGQWAFFGGVLPVLYSGKHVIDLIKNNY